MNDISALPGTTEMPGRCGVCGFHVATQGHRDGCTGPPPPVMPDLDGIAADVAVARRAVAHLAGKQRIHAYWAHPQGRVPPLPRSDEPGDPDEFDFLGGVEIVNTAIRLLLDGAPVTVFDWTDPATPETLRHNRNAQSTWQAVKPPPKRKRGSRSGHAVLGTTEYGLEGLRREIATLEATPEGGRNDQLNKAAFNLGTLVGSSDLPEALVVDTLWDAARAAGLDVPEIGKTLRSGLEAGKANPRTRR